MVIVFFGVMAVASLTPIGKQIFGENSSAAVFKPSIAKPKDAPPKGGATTGAAASSGATTGATPKPDTKVPTSD